VQVTPAAVAEVASISIGIVLSDERSRKK